MTVLILGTLMSALDATVTNVALHTLGTEMHVAVVDVQWVTTGYLLAVAGAIPASGWLARRFRARRVYLIAILLFSLSSGLCAAAQSLSSLVAFRVLQGLAGGTMAPLTQLIAAELAGPETAGRTLGRVWTVTSLASVMGPSLGGLMVDGPGWRWIFLMNVPLGLIATAAGFWLLPDTPRRACGRLDVGGLVRLSIGVPALVLGLAHAESSGRPVSLATLLPLAVGAALVIDFIRHALRHESPLLDIRLYTRPAFALGGLSLFAYTVASFGVLLLLPLYFQQVRHASPAVAGLLIGPQALGSAIGLTAAVRSSNPQRVARAAAAGLVVLVGTTTSLAALSPSASYLVICAILFAAGFCGGLAWIASITVSYARLDPEEISHASPLVSAVSRIASAVGTALAAMVLQHELDVHATGATGGAVAAYHGSFRWAILAMLAATVLYSLLGWTASGPANARRGFARKAFAYGKG